MDNYYWYSTSGCKGGEFELAHDEHIQSYYTCDWRHVTNTPRLVRWKAVEPGSHTKRSYQPQSEVSWKEGDTGANFTEIKNSGEIRMTDYSVGVIRTTSFVVPYKKTWVLHGRGVLGYDLTSYSKNCTDGPLKVFGPAKSHVETQLEEETFYTDYSKIGEDLSGIYRCESFDYRKTLDAAVTSLQIKLVNEMALTYDALTDAFEAKSTFDLASTAIRSLIAPLKELRKFRNELAKKPIRTISSAWLTYRYGILPVVYSVQDIMSMIETQRDTYMTRRVSKQLNLNLDSVKRDLTIPHIYETGTASIQLRGTAKARFGNSAKRAFDQTGLNPLVATWEIIPYSLIVDWFFSVGDYLRVMFYNSYADAENMCISVKVDKTQNTVLYIPESEQEYQLASTEISGPYSGANNDWSRFNEDRVALAKSTRVTRSHRVDQTLLTEEESSYNRTVFSPQDINMRPTFDPNGLAQWKRQVDLAAMSLQQVLRLLPR